MEVADLTTLARRSGEKLPVEAVTRFVDGREEARVRQKIRELVAHLARLQE